MEFEKEFPSLKDFYNQYRFDVSTCYKGTGKVHFAMNIYPEKIIQEHCLDKQRVKEVMEVLDIPLEDCIDALKGRTKELTGNDGLSKIGYEFAEWYKNTLKIIKKEIEKELGLDDLK